MSTGVFCVHKPYFLMHAWQHIMYVCCTVDICCGTGSIGLTMAKVCIMYFFEVCSKYVSTVQLMCNVANACMSRASLEELSHET